MPEDLLCQGEASFDEKQAIYVAADMSSCEDGIFEAYECPYCHQWHVHELNWGDTNEDD